MTAFRSPRHRFTPRVRIPSRVELSLKRGAADLSGALFSLSPLPSIAVFALCVLLLVSFTSLQQNADGLLLAIMSLQKPTVYYWGADRYGILTALLAVWIRNPTLNMYSQILIQLCAGLTAPLFFCSMILRRASDAWRAALLSDCLMILFGSGTMMKQLFVGASPYGTSLACAGLATIALRATSGRLGGVLLKLLGAALLVTAYIVNFGLVIIALPLVGLFALVVPSVHSTRLLVLHGLAAVVGYLLPRILVPDFHTSLSLQISFANMTRYAAVVWNVTGWWLMSATLLPAVALILYLWLARRHRPAILVLILVAATVGVAIFNFDVIASSRWLVMNRFHVRYIVPDYLLLMSIGGLSLWLAAKFMLRSATARSVVFAGLTALLLLAAFLRQHGHRADNSNIIADDRRDLARAVAEQYVAHSLDGIAARGRSTGYWDVWPAVFLTEQYHYDSGYGGPNVIGITGRGEVRRPEFAARLATQGRLRLACIDLDPTECAVTVAMVMATAGLHATEFSPAQQLPGNHRLVFVEINPAGPKQ